MQGVLYYDTMNGGGNMQGVLYYDTIVQTLANKCNGLAYNTQSSTLSQPTSKPAWRIMAATLSASAFISTNTMLCCSVMKS
jgi:hypothetical protein